MLEDMETLSQRNNYHLNPENLSAHGWVAESFLKHIGSRIVYSRNIKSVVVVILKKVKKRKKG